MFLKIFSSSKVSFSKSGISFVENLKVSLYSNGNANLRSSLRQLIIENSMALRNNEARLFVFNGKFLAVKHNNGAVHAAIGNQVKCLRNKPTQLATRYFENYTLTPMRADEIKKLASIFRTGYLKCQDIENFFEEYLAKSAVTATV